jgi:hypothetical protein
MRISIITLTTLTLGTLPLPLTIPAICLSVTVPGRGGSGLRPRSIWASIHGVWSRVTPASLADTCPLPRCVVLRARLARISTFAKSMTRRLRHCAPSPRSPPATCHSWADSRGVVVRSRGVYQSFGFLRSASGLSLLSFNIGNPTGKRKVGGSTLAIQLGDLGCGHG